MSNVLDGLENLPVAAVLPQLLEHLSRTNRVILRAPPGAGKTTLLPLTLLRSGNQPGKLILTQPRRVAARAIAARLCQLAGTALGEEIGYQVRGERRWHGRTQLIAMTTGVLLRRLLSDPFLENFSTVALDEFHERTLELDVALGMIKRLQETVRPDLRLVVMSATLNCGPLVEYLEQSPVVESPGRLFPVAMRYARQYTQDDLDRQVVEILPTALSSTPGHLLVFLPGVGEIKRTRRAIEHLASKADCDVFELYGDLPPDEQDRVLAPATRRKIILSTNVAETSLTIDGVSGVIDSGRARVLRFDPAVGLSRLNLESISLASADQRAGRAGRQGPGICFRLWTESMNRGRPEFDTPEILRGDLSGAVLQLASLGERDTAEFPWLTPPSPEAIESAKRTLRSLGALSAEAVTPRGQAMLAMPVAPRLARLLLAAQEFGVGERGALAAALLSERDPFRAPSGREPRLPAPSRDTPRSDSDLVDRVAAMEAFMGGEPRPELQVAAARQVARTARLLCEALAELRESDSTALAEEAGRSVAEGEQYRPATAFASAADDDRLRQAIAAAYWDRLARRRQIGSDRGVMVGGVGVKLAKTSAVRDAEFFVCLDVEQRPGDSEVRLASAVERERLPVEWVSEGTEYFFHPTQRNVQARRREFFMDLVIDEKPVPATDLEKIAEVLLPQVLAHWERVFPADDPEVGGLLTRLACARAWLPEHPWPKFDEADLHELARAVSYGCRSLDEVRSARWGDHLRAALGSWQGQLDQWLPVTWKAPSGSQVDVAYEVGRPPKLSIRLQELFGLAETPRLAGGRIACLLELLGPNYRPQQLTSDLASFWKNTYPTIRKELLRRYPKHHWPENPLQAAPTKSGLKRDAR